MSFGSYFLDARIFAIIVVPNYGIKLLSCLAQCVETGEPLSKIDLSKTKCRFRRYIRIRWLDGGFKSWR